MVPVDSETRSLAHKARLSLRKMKEFSLPLLPPATVADYLRRRRDMSAGIGGESFEAATLRHSATLRGPVVANHTHRRCHRLRRRLITNELSFE